MSIIIHIPNNKQNTPINPASVQDQKFLFDNEQFSIEGKI